jgi:hypothetical protein
VFTLDRPPTPDATRDPQMHRLQRTNFYLLPMLIRHVRERLGLS